MCCWSFEINSLYTSSLAVSGQFIVLCFRNESIFGKNCENFLEVIGSLKLKSNYVKLLCSQIWSHYSFTIIWLLRTIMVLTYREENICLVIKIPLLCSVYRNDHNVISRATVPRF